MYFSQCCKMVLDYEQKLYQLYKYQNYVFQAYGIFFAPTSSLSRAENAARRAHFGIMCMWIATYNLQLLTKFIILPTIVEKITKALFGLVTSLGVLVKFLHAKQNAPLFWKQVQFLFKDTFAPADAAEEAIFERTIFASIIIRNGYALVSLCSVMYMFICQMLTDPYELPFNPHIPFEFDRSICLVAVHVYAFLSMSNMCLINIAYESWCTSFLLFAKAQLEYLEHRLTTIGNTTADNATVHEELKSCIRHHADIVDFVRILERSFSTPMSIQIFCSIIVLCCNFYALSFTTSILVFINFFLYNMAMLAQIFLLCFYSNEVTLTSQRLPFALYSTDWMNWNRVNRRLILLTMQRFQQPIIVKSLNRCKHFDLSTFTTIINTSYSYFALLKQMNH